jgi:DNA-binding MurR/RpiR family transcriptional regulator
LDSEDLVVLFAPGRKTPEIDVIVDEANLVGARILVITDHLLDHLTQPITLALRAPHTPTGLTTASLAELLISDILIQGVASIGPEAAVQSSHKLNNLRSRLGYPGR